ncbi:hypothetical protein [Agreia sp. COWG]|uniref:hypothetical protein n=1 Tax=Agreia sp. COWG TaxID=2773266 RepID=UPI0019278BAC|nr:hypothetical protein [Agreia sp. COWG]CAD6016017.1 conserved exported protein of unknown function [Agreia sp. COWG]
MRARAAAAVGAAAIGLLLTGCVASAPAGPSSTPTGDVTTSAPATVNVDGFTPAPAAPADGLDGQDDDGPVVVPTDAPPGAVIPSGDSITPELAARAEISATGFLKAFIRKDITWQDWENGYLAFLTPYSQTAYQGTAQRNVPGTKVTGSAALADSGTNTTTSAVVTIPTDVGVYQVMMLATGSGAWLVQRALLPGATK